MEVRRTRATLAAGRGQRMVVTGVVRGTDCAPRAGVAINAWQANAHGRYGPDPEHKCCYLQATVRTDSRGRYALETIVPAAYAAGGSPHIHLEADGLLTELLIDGRPAHVRYDIVLPQR